MNTKLALSALAAGARAHRLQQRSESSTAPARLLRPRRRPLRRCAGDPGNGAAPGTCGTMLLVQTLRPPADSASESASRK